MTEKNIKCDECDNESIYNDTKGNFCKECLETLKEFYGEYEKTNRTK